MLSVVFPRCYCAPPPEYNMGCPIFFNKFNQRSKCFSFSSWFFLAFIACMEALTLVTCRFVYKKSTSLKIIRGQEQQLDSRRNCTSGAEIYTTPTLLRVTKARASYVLPANETLMFRAVPLSQLGKFVVLGDQEAWKGYVSIEFHELFRVLRYAYGWGHINGNSWAEVADALETYGKGGGSSQPQVLVCMERWDMSNWGPRDPRIAAGGTRVWLMTDDLHWLSEEQRLLKSSLVNSSALDALVGTYTNLFDGFFPQSASIPRIHLPHAVSAHYLLPINHSPTPQVLLAGAASLPWYPYRALVASKIKAGDTRFTQLVHPGYSTKELVNKSHVGAGFAGSLHTYIAVITDGLTLNYTVAKLFEIPATGALLLANSELAPHLTSLGLISGVHYISYTKETLDGIVDWILSPQNRPTVDVIREQGQALVWARHTVYHRAAAMDAAARTLSGKPF